MCYFVSTFSIDWWKRISFGDELKKKENRKRVHEGGKCHGHALRLKSFSVHAPAKSLSLAYEGGQQHLKLCQQQDQRTPFLLEFHHLCQDCQGITGAAVSPVYSLTFFLPLINQILVHTKIKRTDSLNSLSPFFPNSNFLKKIANSSSVHTYTHSI